MADQASTSQSVPACPTPVHCMLHLSHCAFHPLAIAIAISAYALHAAHSTHCQTPNTPLLVSTRVSNHCPWLAPPTSHHLCNQCLCFPFYPPPSCCIASSKLILRVKALRPRTPSLAPSPSSPERPTCNLDQYQCSCNRLQLPNSASDAFDSSFGPAAAGVCVHHLKRRKTSIDVSFLRIFYASRGEWPTHESTANEAIHELGAYRD